LNILLIANFTVEGIGTAEDLVSRPEVLTDACNFVKRLILLLGGQTVLIALIAEQSICEK